MSVQPPVPALSGALLIVDVQVDFCPGGALAVPHGDAVIPVLNRVAALAHARGWPVYASRDWHPPDTRHFKAFGGRWPRHCVAGSPGAAFPPDLHLPAETVVISKGQSRDDEGYTAFDGTSAQGRPLADDLKARGVDRLLVGGLATDYCVRASVLDACRAGFQVTLLRDGVAGLDAETTRQAFEEMRAAGAHVADSWDLTGPA